MPGRGVTSSLRHQLSGLRLVAGPLQDRVEAQGGIRGVGERVVGLAAARPMGTSTSNLSSRSSSRLSM